MLAVKTNKYVVPLGNEKLYRLGVVVHILFICISMLYFVNPMLMIYGDAIIIVAEIIIFSAYSISLTNYITKYYSESVPEFQIVKNELDADASIIGLVIATLCTMISLDFAIMFFIAFNFCFSVFMIWNWNYFKKYEVKYKG